MSSVWNLKLFGSFGLISPEGKPFPSKWRKMKLLFIYLALSPDGLYSRKSLATALFGEDDPIAEANFAVLLMRLKRVLNDLSPVPVIFSKSGQIGLLLENIDVDVREFTSLAQRSATEFNIVKKTGMLMKALEIASQPILEEDRVPLLLPQVENIELRILSIVADLAGLPLSTSTRHILLERVQSFESHAKHNPVQIALILRAYGELGQSETVLRIFSEYEDWIQGEFGDQPRKELIDLFEKYANPHRIKATVLPKTAQRPPFSVGRETEYGQLADHMQRQGGHQLLTLVGMSGIGKSHILKELYWRLEHKLNIAYFDLGYTPGESILEFLSNQPQSAVLLDDVTLDKVGLIERILCDYPSVRIAAASQSRVGLNTEITLQIKPLHVDDHKSDSVRFLEYILNNASYDYRRSDEKLLLELAALCNGIPLALEIAAKLATSIGLVATVSCMRVDDVGKVTVSANNLVQKSLARAVEKSFLNLGPGARKLVLCVSLAFPAIPCELAVKVSDSSIEDLDGAILSGLINPDGDLFLSIADFVALTIRVIQDDIIDDFRLELAHQSIKWFENKSAEQPVDLRLSPAVMTGLGLMDVLEQSDFKSDATNLFSKMRPWLGSFRIGEHKLRAISDLIQSLPRQYSPKWAEGIIALGIAYFHSNLLDEMIDLLHSIIEDEAFHSLDLQFQGKLVSLLGLAHRQLEHWDIAEKFYRRAIDITEASQHSDPLTMCWYNLAVMFESLGRMSEAKEAFDNAAANLSGRIDSRLRSLIRCGIGRHLYLTGEDLVTAEFQFLSALRDAMEKNDKRGASEILQNLGLVYFDLGYYLKSALVVVLGSQMLIEFGYDDHFRRLLKSSFVTLAAGLLKLKLHSIALTARSFIDRLGDSDIYSPSKPLFDFVISETLSKEARTHSEIANEAEVAVFLKQCFECLKDIQGNSKEYEELDALLAQYSA